MLGESPLGNAPLGSTGGLESIEFPATTATLSVVSAGALNTAKLPSGSATVSVALQGEISSEKLPGTTAVLSVSMDGRLIVKESRLHSILYAAVRQRIHQVSYNLGDLPSRLHSIEWCAEARRLHEILYEGSGVSPLVSGYRLHEISYSVIGADSLASSVRLHEILYEGSGVSPLVSDQRLHSISYAVVGADPISSVSAFHHVSYAVATDQALLHAILYQSVVEASRLHAAGWKADIEQRRMHEASYHTVDTSTIVEAGTITVGDGGLNVYDFLSLSITSDEDSSYWQCEVALKDANDYLRFPRDTAFVIRLLSVDFHFIVDSRSLQRSIDDDGNYQEACTISGLSPLVRYASPRATKLTKTWNAPILASAAVAELIGTVTWDLVDWTIPAYRLAAENAAPLDVAKQIVEAVGGLIEAQPDGSVVCRHRWPVSISALDTVVADHALDERMIFAASEEPTQDELIDRVRIFDSEAGFQDRLEYVPNKIGAEDDPRHGILYAFPSPWRTGLRIVTTRPSQIVVGSMTEGTRSIVAGSTDYPPELLTFSERTASTQYPIMSLTSLDWLDEDLGAASFTPYATTLEAGNGTYGGYSLAEVQYATRYLAVPITCLEPVAEIEAQFLLLEETTDG